MKISCFLPCRKGSERVPRKNIKPFMSFEYGLVELKLRQLSRVGSIESIILSTNDEEIIEISKALHIRNLIIHRRAENLCTSATSTDDLVSHALELCPNQHIMWTHVTSPFVTTEDYAEIIDAYFSSLKAGFDSLMTTSLIHAFLWNERGPLNYDRTLEKWPRTQTLEPIHEINSAAFISHSANYKKYNDRIGVSPKLLPLSKMKSFDVDWPEDFLMAEMIAKSGVGIL